MLYSRYPHCSTLSYSDVSFLVTTKTGKSEAIVKGDIIPYNKVCNYPSFSITNSFLSLFGSAVHCQATQYPMLPFSALLFSLLLIIMTSSMYCPVPDYETY